MPCDFEDDRKLRTSDSVVPQQPVAARQLQRYHELSS